MSFRKYDQYFEEFESEATPGKQVKYAKSIALQFEEDMDTMII